MSIADFDFTPSIHLAASAWELSEGIDQSLLVTLRDLVDERIASL